MATTAGTPAIESDPASQVVARAKCKRIFQDCKYTLILTGRQSCGYERNTRKWEATPLRPPPLARSSQQPPSLSAQLLPCWHQPQPLLQTLTGTALHSASPAATG